MRVVMSALSEVLEARPLLLRLLSDAAEDGLELVPLLVVSREAVAEEELGLMDDVAASVFAKVDELLRGVSVLLVVDELGLVEDVP